MSNLSDMTFGPCSMPRPSLTPEEQQERLKGISDLILEAMTASACGYTVHCRHIRWGLKVKCCYCEYDASLPVCSRFGCYAKTEEYVCVDHEPAFWAAVEERNKEISS